MRFIQVWTGSRVPGVRDAVRGRSGFTLVELLTVIAVTAVLGTLVVSAMGNVRVRQERLICHERLRGVALAVEVYTRDAGKRPRSLTRVRQFAGPSWDRWLAVCPADPELRRQSDKGWATNQFWGNFANASQEPWNQTDLSPPEAGSWTAELAEVQESEPFSFLHPLGWRRSAWQRLAALDNSAAIVVCQLHGVRVPAPPVATSFKAYLQYEGEVQRAALDGSVVRRKVFRPGLSAEGVPGTDYPWELYTDAQLPLLR